MVTAEIERQGSTPELTTSEDIDSTTPKDIETLRRDLIFGHAAQKVLLEREAINYSSGESQEETR